jgi:hypothetical protein
LRDFNKLYGTLCILSATVNVVTSCWPVTSLLTAASRGLEDCAAAADGFEISDC